MKLNHIDLLIYFTLSIIYNVNKYQ